MPRKRRIIPLALMLLPIGAVAADNPAAHEHGHAQLQLAIEGNQIDLFLLSPAINLVGFEHAPENEEQTLAVKELTRWSRQTPIINTANGTCSIQSHALHASWSEHQEQEHDHEHADEHDHDHEHADTQHEHEHEHADEHDHEHGHADLELSQTLICADLAEASSLTTPLIRHFTGMERLDIQWVGPGGQGAAQLGAGENSFSIRR